MKFVIAYLENRLTNICDELNTIGEFLAAAEKAKSYAESGFFKGARESLLLEKVRVLQTIRLLKGES